MSEVMNVGVMNVGQSICITELVVAQYLSVVSLYLSCEAKCLPNFCIRGQIVALYEGVVW